MHPQRIASKGSWELDGMDGMPSKASLSQINTWPLPAGGHSTTSTPSRKYEADAC
jgi:hypothetical protein